MTRHDRQSGFTLLEVAITIGILVTLTIAVAELLSSNLEIRARLSQASKVNHRMSIAMDRITKDLQLAYLVSKRETTQNAGRKSDQRPTIFKFQTRKDSADLSFTTLSHQSRIRNSKDYELSYVVYKIQEDEKISGVTHLYRGEFDRLPKELRDDPPMKLLARYVKNLRIQAWRGDGWVKDRWDSSRSEQRDALPHLVKIELEAWPFEPDQIQIEENQVDMDDQPTDNYSTVVYPFFAPGFKEVKEPSKNIRWDRM